MSTIKDLYPDCEEWAKARKRITNGQIRNRFDVDEDEADEIYAYLKAAGIVGHMGYVQQHE